MTRRLIVLGSAVLLAFGLSFSAFAGSTTDGDSDGVPDGYDNCSATANGPSAGTGACNSQEDYDADGYGQPCDGDVDNSGNTLVGSPLCSRCSAARLARRAWHVPEAFPAPEASKRVLKRAPRAWLGALFLFMGRSQSCEVPRLCKYLGPNSGRQASRDAPVD